MPTGSTSASDRDRTSAPLIYSPCAPADDAYVCWPESFGNRFLICVDTEEEFDWGRPFDRTSRSVSHMKALPAAHRRFADRGVPVTYLVDHPIATNPRAIDALSAVLADGVSTVGTQLHPWVNPPFDEVVGIQNSFAGNLPVSLERKKLALLTDAIMVAFGTLPVIYRAGRYGLGPNSLGLLAELGYRIDTSMRAGYDYRLENGPDYSAIGNAAFRTGPDNSLIELPLSTIFTGVVRRWGANAYRSVSRLPRGPGIAARLGLLNRVALTPEDMPLAEVLHAIDTALRDGVRVLNFSFHSPSIVPGFTPYVRDAHDLAAFNAWWDHVLDHLEKRGVRPATPAMLLQAAG